MVSKQQDISSEISTGECSTVNSFGFAEKLLRYIEQEEVFSHWTLTNIHSKKNKARIITLYFSPRNRRRETKHANAHGTKFGDKRLEKLVSIPDIGEHIFVSSTSSCLLNTLVLRIMSFKTIKEKPKKKGRTDGRPHCFPILTQVSSILKKKITELFSSYIRRRTSGHHHHHHRHRFFNLRARKRTRRRVASAAIANKEENALLTQPGFWSG